MTIHHGDLSSSWGNFWLHPLTHLICGGRGRRRIIEVWLQSHQRLQFINVSLPIKLSHLWFFLQIAVTPETEAKVRATEVDAFLPLRAHFDSDLHLFCFFFSLFFLIIYNISAKERASQRNCSLLRPPLYYWLAWKDGFNCNNLSLFKT